jgi:hypothetical protein
MDIAFGDNIWKPRRLILSADPKSAWHPYETVSERDGVGSHSDHSLRTLPEWLSWIEKFRDELTGKEIREAIEAAKADFVEPQSWADFRKRYAETGDAFIK